MLNNGNCGGNYFISSKRFFLLFENFKALRVSNSSAAESDLIELGLLRVLFQLLEGQYFIMSISDLSVTYQQLISNLLYEYTYNLCRTSGVCILLK